MLKTTVLGAALAAALASPLAASAADDKELAAIRAQIKEMKESYEARLQALEQRLQDAQAAAAQAQNAALAAQTPAPAPAPVAAAPAAPAAANAFNPNISLVLGGTYANLSQDPEKYRLQGFVPPVGEVGPGKRGFNLGESELTFAANIDPMFSGQLTFALSGEDTVGVEEAFVQTRAIANGINLKAGRFLSSIGYLNSQHAHTWDFVDAPLAYQAFLGGQYKPDGLQAKWLAPTDTLVEIGAELGNGGSFPGNARNKNGAGAGALYAHVGDDIGDSASWRAGLSLLRTGAANREFDNMGEAAAFSGSSRMVVADAIYKWAPNGNPTQRNLKLQGEYFRRKESGELAAASAVSGYDSTQSGWYLQGVFQFIPNWRAGLRYDRLDSGTPAPGTAASFPLLSAYSPKRTSAMVDYSPSEFSRLRLQLARDQSRPGVTDNQIFLQYIMSLGTHAAHSF
ncbi:TonB-dependent receptor [Massilia sp. R2A-15]|uniref:TonB-dependent receptor n=1 Tax=Massilia sp. R2A-15 TaxID=3064278 RepID=UPI0027337DDB|nr:TonB-dependent receptor [Massilia sp. R2A-15]WLI91201.1 TonB-dependent receptor [Massilia sp. R2A-15]